MKDIKKRFISLKGFITRRRKSKSPDVMQQNPRNIEEVNENEEEKLQKADVQMEIVNSNHVQNKVLSQHKLKNRYLSGLFLKKYSVFLYILVNLFSV